MALDDDGVKQCFFLEDFKVFNDFKDLKDFKALQIY